MWEPAVVTLMLLVAACSPTVESATTTAVLPTTSNIAQTTMTADNPTPTTAPATTTTVTEPTATTEPSTTTKPPPTTTTVTAPEGNEPPAVEIISPASLSSHTASYDADRENFGVNVALSVIATDPNRDTVTVTWSSNTQGGLGTGESIVAFLSTGGYDASQPVITETAADQRGASTSVSIQTIVWIPSDASQAACISDSVPCSSHSRQTQPALP